MTGTAGAGGLARRGRWRGWALRWAVAGLGVALALLCWLGVLGAELPLPARHSLGVAALAIGLWGSELVAMPVTAVLVMVLLYVGGAVPALPQAFAGFASPVLFFLLGSAGLGIAAEQTGLAERLAAWMLARSRGSGRRLLLDLLLTLPLQALVVPSAMSRNTVLVPVYDRVLARLGRPPRLGAAVMLALGVLGPLASTMFLSGGTSPVAAAAAIGGFTWVSWFVAVAPPYYLLLLVSSVALWFVCPPDGEMELTLPDAAVDHTRRLSAAEWRVAVVVVGTSLLWMLDQFTHWPPAVPALLALLVLVWPRLGVMSWSTFARQAPWSTCFVLAGAVSLAEALASSGAAPWVARGLFAVFPVPDSPVVAALVVYAVTCVIALAVPNRAAAITLVIPLASAYAAAGVLSVVAAGLVVLIAVDLETIYPAQTAANLIAYDRGYFGAGLLARFNIVTLGAGALVVALLALPWWQTGGFAYVTAGTSRARMASPNSTVVAWPPRSRVRTRPSASTASTAPVTARAASFSPSQSSIICTARIVAIGLAIPRPAMSGAEPWMGSKNEGLARVGSRLAPGAMPRLPARAAPSSETMSPKRLVPSTTSNHSGLLMRCTVKASMW